MPSGRSASRCSGGNDVTALREIFYPRSIAVIGASKDPTKRGFRAVQKLLEDGFEGQIYPINPKEKDILGCPAYPSLGDVRIPDPPSPIWRDHFPIRGTDPENFAFRTF